MSTAAPTQVWDATGGEQVVDTVVDAGELGFRRPAEGALRGDDAAYNAGVATAVIAGERSARLDPVRDAVLLNAAAALVAHDAASGADPTLALGDRLAAALPRAVEAVDSGAAGALLTRWATLTRSLAGAV